MFIWYRNLRKELIVIFPLFTNGITLLKKYSDVESLLNRHLGIIYNFDYKASRIIIY